VGQARGPQHPALLEGPLADGGGKGLVADGAQAAAKSVRGAEGAEGERQAVDCVWLVGAWPGG
jgi:hypothetical protein